MPSFTESLLSLRWWRAVCLAWRHLPECALSSVTVSSGSRSALFREIARETKANLFVACVIAFIAASDKKIEAKNENMKILLQGSRMPSEFKPSSRFISFISILCVPLPSPCSYSPLLPPPSFNPFQKLIPLYPSQPKPFIHRLVCP